MSLRQLPELLLRRPHHTVSYYDPERVLRTVPFERLHHDCVEASNRLASWGLGHASRVGILAPNSYAWVVLDLALLRMGCVSMALPKDAFGNEDLPALADHYALSLVFTTPDILDRLPASISYVVPLEIPLPASGRPRQVVPATALDPDVFTLVFSSGTTGTPKCLMMSSRRVELILQDYSELCVFREEDAILVAMPLEHYQQRAMIYAAIVHGFHFIVANPVNIFHALRHCRPTILVGPPMVFELLETRCASLPAPLRGLLFLVGEALRPVRSHRLRATLQRCLFGRFHRAYGGRMRLMLSGSAPARTTTLELHHRLGLPLYEAYGLTEIGIVAINLPEAHRIGSAGQAVYPDSIRIASDGEITVAHDRFQSVGYLPEDTGAESFPDSRPFLTGDIGHIDGDGFLYVTGRKKSLIVTRGGQKIHPEQIEQQIGACPVVRHAVVFGGPDLPGLTALVALRSDGPDYEACTRVRAFVDRLNARLIPGSRIVRVTFTEVVFRPDNGLLTHALKLNRDVIYRRFRAQLVAAS